MSNIIPFGGNSEVPAHLAALFGDDSNIAPRITINQLSYRGKTWRRIVDGEETPLTRVDKDSGDQVAIPIVTLVVLDHNKGRSRAFYEGNFEEGKNAKPRCASMDGVVPDATITDPCAATCATCPNAVKGSKITENGKQTTACSPFKRVAVVPSGQIGQHPVMLLRLAQTSVWDKDNAQNEGQGWYAWDQYLDMLRARGAKHTAAVETKVKFDLRMAYPKLLFSAARWLNPEEAAAAKQKLTDDVDDITKILTGGGDDGTSGQPGVPHEGTSGVEGAGDAPPKAANKPKATPKPDTSAADAAAAAEAQAAAKAEADAKAAKQAAKEEKKRKAAEAAAAAVAAAEAAAKAAEDDDDDDDDGADAFSPPPAATPKPAATTKAATRAEPVTAEAVGVATESDTPDGLKALLDGWDDADD
jgi:hypothetical protein